MFAFRDRPDDQGPFTYEPKLTYTSIDATDTKANCLIDGYDYNFGMPTHLKTGEFKMLNRSLTSDTTLTYSKRYSDIGYNFFAYHLDDDSVVQSVQRQDQRIVCDLKIDGTQDIMVGYAPRLTPQVLDTRYMGVALTEEQRNKVLNIGNYSSYASALGIHPIVNMNHLLTRLRFTAYPGHPSCDGVKITGVEVEAHNQARFTVAATNLNELEAGLQVQGGKTKLQLRQQQKTTDPKQTGFTPTEPLNPDDHVMVWDPADATKELYDRTPKVLGCDMLVLRDSVYTMTLHYALEIKNLLDPTQDHVENFTSTFTLKARDLNESIVDYNPFLDTYFFRTGQVYNIRLGIYGLDGVNADVDIDPWGNGGTIDNPDDWEWEP